MTKRSDIPFAADAARYFLPWMSMLMVFIAVLTLSGAMITYSSLNEWNRSISGSLTVQIPTYEKSGKQRGDEVQKDIETAHSILATAEGVLGITLLNDEQMAVLMNPWVSDETNVSELPIPKLLDVTIDTNNLPDLTQIKADLAEQVPYAILDSHRIWLSNLMSVANGVINLVIFILILLIATTSFTIVYSTRTSLTVHRPVIALVHMMGANDFYIALQYARRSFKLIFIGSILGVIIALPVMFSVAYLIQTSAQDFILNPDLSTPQWLVLFAIPFAMALLAFATTFKTVSNYLKRFL